MKDNIIVRFERLNRYDSQVKSEEIVTNNPYPKLSIVLQWLVSIYKAKNIHNECLKPFDLTIIDDNVKDALDAGNIYYQQLFRASDLIPLNANVRENPKVFTDIINWLYNKINNEEYQYEDNLIVYGDLLKNILSAFGEKIAEDRSIDKYKYWLPLSQMRHYNIDAFTSWLNSIPIKTLKKEIKKFYKIDKKLKYVDIVQHSDLRTRNIQQVEAFLQSLNDSDGGSIISYVHKTTQNSNLLHFKGNIYFDFSLLLKLPIRYLVSFIDSMQFPNLQDHVFIFIKDLDYYPEIIKEIIQPPNKFQTNREILLIIALNNYFKFLQNTASALSGYASNDIYSNSSNITTNKQIAQEEYDVWINIRIPDSFRNILMYLLNGKEFYKSEYLILFFEWLNGYNLSTNSSRGNYDKVLQILREEFQKLFEKHIECTQFIISNFPLEKYNWNVFNILNSSATEASSNEKTRDSLLSRYKDYLDSNNFQWNSSNVFSLETINQAYHLSYLLSFIDSSEQWLSIQYNKHRAYHEGWKFALSEKKSHEFREKEDFLLSVEVGTAYYAFEQSKVDMGNKIIDNVLRKCINQLRAQRFPLNEYVIPLKFITITFSKFRTDRINELILKYLDDIDSLQLKLELLHDITNELEDKRVINNASKTRIVQMLLDFWIIEYKYRDPILKPKLEEYNKYKEEIISNFNLEGYITNRNNPLNLR